MVGELLVVAGQSRNEAEVGSMKVVQVTEGSIITQIYGGAVCHFIMKHTAKNSPTAFENTEGNK